MKYQIMLKQAKEPLPHPTLYAPDLPEAVEKVMIKALARKPANRYASMGRFSKALEKLLTEKKRAAKQGVIPNVPPVDSYENPETVWQIDNQETFSEQETCDELEEISDSYRQGSIPPASSHNKVVFSRSIWLAILGLSGTMILIVGWFILKPGSHPLPTATSPFLTAPDSFTPPVSTSSSFFATPNPGHTETPFPSPTNTPAQVLQQGSTMVRPKDQMVMVYVPDGTFTMGDTASHAQSECLRISTECVPIKDITFIDEAPPHSVTLNAFWIDQTEVSNAMYALCVRAGKCTDNTNGSNNLPAVNVSWFEASKYCVWAGGRLPTEAEWEKAAHGTDGSMFPWGDSAPSCSKANYLASSDGGCPGKAVSVDSNQSGASPYGALNMVGNVWEWVADWFDGSYYSYSPLSNPKGPDPTKYKVMRGGSFANQVGFMIPTGRGSYNPNDKLNSIGFRCAADP